MASNVVVFVFVSTRDTKVDAVSASVMGLLSRTGWGREVQIVVQCNRSELSVDEQRLLLQCRNRYLSTSTRQYFWLDAA